jgi:DNA repair photolyase
MDLVAHRAIDTDSLIQTVGDRFVPMFEKGNHSQHDKRAIYRYLFSRRPKKLPPSLKHRLIHLYDPMADRSSRFPDGLRWCLNVYVGCEINCGYCYVNAYSQLSVGSSCHAKAAFTKKLIDDLQALMDLCVPPAPLHMSNSTDPLQQGLEGRYGHTLFSLRKIAEYRSLFTSVVILTKNPQLLCTDDYMAIITKPVMSPFVVQITCAFCRNDVRSFFEPNAPSVQSRLEALKFLAKNGVDVELRIDPLFPSSRIQGTIRGHKPLPHYALPEAQTHEDLATLVRFAKKSKARAVIASALKVPVSNRAKQCKDWFATIYSDANPTGRRVTMGGSWRLPAAYQNVLISTVSDICTQAGVGFKHCIHDVLTRK